jgi:hypothetical protein
MPTDRKRKAMLTPLPRGMSRGFYEFMGAGCRRSHTGTPLMWIDNMPDLTAAQLSRLQNGATCIAVPMEPQPEARYYNSDHEYAAYSGWIWQPGPGKYPLFRWVNDGNVNEICPRIAEYCPLKEGQPVPTLPHLRWGKSRAVRLRDVTPVEEALGGWIFGSELPQGTETWLWLVEVVSQTTGGE